MTADSVVNAPKIARAKPGPLADVPISGSTAGDGTVAALLSEPLAALPAVLAELRSQNLSPASCAADGTGITAMDPPLRLDATAFADCWRHRRISPMSAIPPSAGSKRGRGWRNPVTPNSSLGSIRPAFRGGTCWKVPIGFRAPSPARG
ncbi:hypothetical protein Q4543_22395 [Salipiger sp. 1_MG-2023]|nr:hypothetical protein [Salipiger sp. 1_MG-2023]